MSDDEGPHYAHAPPNELLRIDAIYMFVSIDETGEG